PRPGSDRPWVPCYYLRMVRAYTPRDSRARHREPRREAASETSARSPDPWRTRIPPAARSSPETPALRPVPSFHYPPVENSQNRLLGLQANDGCLVVRGRRVAGQNKPRPRRRKLGGHQHERTSVERKIMCLPLRVRP